jgi:hypothetical protein
MGWNRNIPQKIFLNTLSHSDMVNKEGIPWCFPCNEAHREWDFFMKQGYEHNEGPSSYEHMNLVEYMDPIYTIPWEIYSFTSEKMELMKNFFFDATMIAILEILNAMDKKSNNKLRKENYLQYTRRNVEIM